MTARYPGHPIDLRGDRRVRQRLPIRGLAILKTKRGVLPAQTVDISAHGVCLTLPHALDVGSRCQVELEIQGDPPRKTSAVGQVCFCLCEKHGYRVGLNCSLAEFIGWDSLRST